MNPLSAIYGGVVGARNALYDRGVLRAQRLQGAVVSVGNLSAGGSGKTPFVMLLGELLKARGMKFDVLSRGYGRKSRGVRLVDPAGLPQEFGDEPLLIARKLQVPVIVGEDRYEAGRFAESKFGPQLHLLDDGFQHRALARDFDIVLVTPQDATDRLLPAGRLREPLAFFAARGCCGAGQRRFGRVVSARRQSWCGACGVELCRRTFRRGRWFFAALRGRRISCLQLRAANIEPVAEAFYRDHHAYSEKDIRELLELKQQQRGRRLRDHRKRCGESGRLSLGAGAARGCAGENGACPMQLTPWIPCCARSTSESAAHERIVS